MEKLTVIPLDKIIGVEIECACGTGIWVSVNPSPSVKMDNKPNCPGCGEFIGDAIIAIGKFREFYGQATTFLKVEPPPKIVNPGP